MCYIYLQSIVMNLSVCPSTCLCDVSDITYLKNRTAEFHELFVLVDCHGSIWLSTCNFVDDVMFSHRCNRFCGSSLCILQWRDHNSRNCCIGSHQILLNDKDQQVHIVCCTLGKICYLQLTCWYRCSWPNSLQFVQWVFIYKCYLNHICVCTAVILWTALYKWMILFVRRVQCSTNIKHVFCVVMMTKLSC